VRTYTSYLKPGFLPVLVPEGFSWGAAIFGFIWLLFHRAWIPAALLLAFGLLVLRLGAGLHSVAPSLALFLLQGLFGRDLWRWSLSLTGHRPGPLVAAPGHDSALARLLTQRADLIGLAGDRL
jgi:hypothetical protein